MSKNLNQVYTANPITVNANTDLMYFMQSPYTVGTDAGMTFANFKAQFSSPITPAALTETNDTNVTLTLGGTPSTALLQATSITAGWTGTLAVARGGSGLGTFTPYALITGGTTSTGNLQQVASLGTSGQVLTSAGAGALPTWTTPTSVTPAALTETNDTNVTLTLGGTPATALLQATSITAGWTGTLAVARGGLGIGTVPANGQIPIGNGSTYTAATLTAGTNISITNAAGSITIDSTGAAGFTTIDQTSTTVTLAANTINITDAGASLVTYTIPAITVLGDTYIIIGASSGGWRVNVGGATTIQYGTSSSTVGISSTNRYDCVTITIAKSALTGFASVHGVQGIITVL